MFPFRNNLKHWISPESVQTYLKHEGHKVSYSMISSTRVVSQGNLGTARDWVSG